MPTAALDVRPFSRLFKALSDETRLRIVALLAQGELCVCHLEEALGLSQPKVSRHLAILRAAGVVDHRREGTWVYYRLTTQDDAECEAQLRSLVKTFAKRAVLRHDLERLIKVRGPEFLQLTGEAMPYNVLFLCTGNSARSIMAEVLLNYWGRDRFRAFSAGSQPRGEVHPLALETLERSHLPTQGLRSKSWSEFARPGAPAFAFVFTVCGNAAREQCPYWPGQPMTAHWGIDDPAAVEGSPKVQQRAFHRAFRELDARIKLFVNLRIELLDKLTLQKTLDEIGTGSQPRAAEGSLKS